MIAMSDKKINGRAVYQVPEQIYTCNTGREGDTFYSFFLTDCLEKVFPNAKPRALDPAVLQVVPGEVPAVQLVYHYHLGREHKFMSPQFTVSVEGAPVPARVRSVECVASDYPAAELADEDYITKEAGVFPDLLLPLADNKILPVHSQYRALWIDFPGLRPEHANRYKIEVCITVDEAIESMGLLVEVPAREEKNVRLPFEMEVLPLALKPQTVLHTEWLHIDSLCDFYKVEPFSEAHWAQIEHFIEMAAQEHAVNMILTPIFTLALNTGFGKERTATQLVDVFVENGVYHFAFDRLRRWCSLCKKYGITHLEISPLFTQWGARFTPKIVANTPQGQQRIFGWDVPATHPEYRRFLCALLPVLCAELSENGYDAEHLRFHISDEPFAALGHSKSYLAAKQVLAGLLDNYIIMDALSDYSLYEQGISQHPIPATGSFQEFYEKGFADPWVYYCGAQGTGLPNRFMAMPSARTRIMGILMYVYGIKGFLHWGYNYYSNMDASQTFNPFWQTSSGRSQPSGDAFLVYPGSDYKPLSSIRAEVVRSSFDDIRLLQLLEGYAGRQAVLALIQDQLGELTFFKYPKGPESLLALHEKVCDELQKHCSPA